jgi:hypothetical protein
MTRCSGDEGFYNDPTIDPATITLSAFLSFVISSAPFFLISNHAVFLAV